MADLDKKAKADAEQRKRRADVDDQDGSGDGTNLLPWDADVERFMERLERALAGFRASMGSSEFRALTLAYRELSFSEKRAVANRLRARHLDNLLRALHAGDHRAYLDGWEAEAQQQLERT